MASSSRLKPKEKGRINVFVDVRGKAGNITKTVQVFTNDPKSPVTTLSVTMHVKDLIHMKKEDAANIFSGECKGCHVEKGRGKKGFKLYSADCIMCHGIGKSASTILDMRKKPKEDIIEAIRNGVEDTSMPGWDNKSGGPLSDDEIESLVDLIKTPKKAKGL